MQQRSDHIAEWIRLTEDKQAVSSQLATKPQGGRPESGIRAAARELNITKDQAHRATKIAGIQPKAKEAAAAAGLDDNQSALLAIARAEPEQQVQAVQEIVQRKAKTVFEQSVNTDGYKVRVTATPEDTEPPAPVYVTATPEDTEPPAPINVTVMPDDTAVAREFERLMAAWDAAGEAARDRFMERAGLLYADTPEDIEEFVRSNGVPKLVRLLDAGEIDLSWAFDLARLAPGKQHMLLRNQRVGAKADADEAETRH